MFEIVEAVYRNPAEASPPAAELSDCLLRGRGLFFACLFVFLCLSCCCRPYRRVNTSSFLFRSASCLVIVVDHVFVDTGRFSLLILLLLVLLPSVVLPLLVLLPTDVFWWAQVDLPSNRKEPVISSGVSVFHQDKLMEIIQEQVMDGGLYILRPTACFEHGSGR